MSLRLMIFNSFRGKSTWQLQRGPRLRNRELHQMAKLGPLPNPTCGVRASTWRRSRLCRETHLSRSCVRVERMKRVLIGPPIRRNIRMPASRKASIQMSFIRLIPNTKVMSMRKMERSCPTGRDPMATKRKP